MQIRNATIQDARAIRDIYRPYVENTAITFEYDAPDEAEFVRRMSTTLKEYPYLVAVSDGQVVGYAYAACFHAREAYRHTVEISIYLSMDCRGRGIGVLLYEELEKRLIRQNVFVMYACITTSPRSEDAYLNDSSIRFHERNGFRLIGSHDRCGYKFDQWYGVIWMEKEIAPRPEKPAPFIPFPETDREML